MVALITAALGVLAIVLQAIAKHKESAEAKEKKQHEKIQTAREDIASGNANAVGNRVDRLCEETSDSARLQSDEDTQRRIATITGS